jgi:hypothetical protein
VHSSNTSGCCNTEELKVSENEVLRIMFLPKNAIVTEGCSYLLKEKQHNLYFSPNIIIVIVSNRAGFFIDQPAYSNF